MLENGRSRENIPPRSVPGLMEKFILWKVILLKFWKPIKKVLLVKGELFCYGALLKSVSSMVFSTK